MFLDDLSDLLTTGGITRPIFKGHTPALAADSVITLYETGGMGAVHVMSTGPGAASTVERPRAQIVCRDADYSVARIVAGICFNLVDGLRARAINGTQYLWMAAVQSPFYLDTDNNGRSRIAFNIDVMKALSTSTST